MKKKLLVVSLALALTVVFAHAAAATGAGGGCECPNRVSGSALNQVPIAEKLNLSDSQVQQLKEINLNTYQAAKPIKIKLSETRFELRQLQIDGKDRSAIEAKSKEIKDLKDQLHKLREQKKQKVQSILTPEQLAKLKMIKGSGHHSGWDK
ncbi:MAG: Spy/CpxP family protein refolding chaperone [Deltaproteobacteria bacterium]